MGRLPILRGKPRKFWIEIVCYPFLRDQRDKNLSLAIKKPPGSAIYFLLKLQTASWNELK